MTTDTERLDALIAKLEGAPRGSRELDHAILEYLPPPAPSKPGNVVVRIAAHWTTSLDAALTLVPEGCWPWLSVYHQGSFGAHAKLYGPRIVHGVAHLTPANAAGYRNATDLWPLALCIASLKARREACR